MKIARPLVAIVPAYNEAGRVARVLKGLAPFVDKIVAVDDGSADGTYREMLGSGAGKLTVLRLPTNCGKGVALRAGFSFAKRTLKAGTIVTIDSDGQHRPGDVPRLVRKMEASGSDIVVGCREDRAGMPFVKRLGNSIIKWCGRALFGITVPDSQSGFRVIGKRAIGKLSWKSSSYSVETEVLANAKRLGLTVVGEIIPTIYNDGYKGTDVLSGVRIVGDMVKWRVFGW
jgi:glycosyltransferase involved in cell wall biosynthesis